MATRMQQRRGTAATWTAANPILGVGEIGYETDTNKFKIGDGSNRWANLTYFVDANSILDGAPELLSSLNDLAAAIGDDPAFFTTVATNLSTHEADTTNVHGITNTADLATKSYADTAEADAISTAAADATSKANAAQNAAESFATSADSALSAALTADIATAKSQAISTAAADATSKANAAKSGAEATAAAALASAVSDLEDYADAAEADAKSYTDTKIADLIDGAPNALNTLNELAASLGDDENYASTITNALALKAPLANPTFTGTVSGISKSMVGLGNVDNTSDVNKPVSTATQTALDAKLDSSTAASTYAPIASPTFTGTVSGISKSMVGLGNVDNTSDADKPVSDATQDALDLKAPIASPTFTGTVSGITKSMVGLGNVDNTSDENKPISVATQSALDLKAPLASPSLTGIPTAPTAALGTNTTQVATTAFVDAAIEALASRNLVLDGGGV